MKLYFVRVSSGGLKDTQRDVRTLKSIQDVGSSNPKTGARVSELVARDRERTMKLM